MNKQFEAEQRRIELLAAEHKSLVEPFGQLRGNLRSNNLSDQPKDHVALILANPPEVEGVVTKVDGTHVEISVGSNSGLRRNQILHVYRVKPAKRYLGKIELLQVGPDRSVGRVLSQFKNGTIQERDRVAPRIIDKKKKR